jgi:hypothetical protein
MKFYDETGRAALLRRRDDPAEEHLCPAKI